MKIIVPSAITASTVVYSNLTNNGIADYNAATIYVKDAVCVYNNIVYKSLVNNNVGATPDAVDSISKWAAVTTCNKWALFDGEINTQSENSNLIHFYLNLSFCDSLALLNIDAERVDINLQFTSPQNITEVVYLYQADLQDTSTINTWEEYFFAERTFQKDLLLTNLPPLSVVAEIKLTKNAGTVGLGMCVVGRQFDGGLDEYKIKTEMRTFSIVSIDEFGKVKRTNREAAKNLTATSIAKTSQYNYITQKLSNLMNKDVLMQAGNGVQQSMMTFGMFSYTTSYDTHGHFYINYEVKGYI